MSILNVNKINPVGGGSTITIAGIASVTSSVTAPSFVGAVTGNVTGNVTGDATGLSGNPSINTTGIVTATAFIPTQGQLSHRNLFINGAMQVAQRGISYTGGSAYGTVDRWYINANGVDENPTQQQIDLDSSDTGPYEKGFRKALKITNGNQTSGLNSTTDRILIQQRIESQNLAQSGWNYTSSSSFITLSFWCKSSVAQTFQCRFQTQDGTQLNFPFETGSLTADTWTKVTKVIPGNSNLTFDVNNEEGMKLEISLIRGTGYTDNSVTNDAWATYASGTRNKDNTTTWYTTNDATFELTGVQLEVGSVATPFEFRSIGEELYRCQRYFFNITGNTGSRSGIPGYANSTSSLRAMVQFPAPMRAIPSISGSSTAMILDTHDDSASFNCSSLTSGGAPTTSNPTQMCIEVNTSGMTNGQGGQLEFRAANGFINFSAEL